MRAMPPGACTSLMGASLTRYARAAALCSPRKPETAEDEMNDVRYAFRQLIRVPAFSVVALLTIALGVGSCAAIFSVVNGMLLRPLPYPDGDRLVVLNETNLPRFPEFVVRPG